jgi:large subunit ribosomal protein L11
MAEKIIDIMVSGGKATPGPPLGPTLAPMGVNVPQVVAKINEATKDFVGMNVPVKIIVDPSTKAFKIEVGSPPVAELLKKEAKIEKGSGTKDVVAGNLSFDQVVSVAKRNRKSLGKSLKDSVNEILGTCVSLNMTVNGSPARQMIQEVKEGKHDSVLH